MSDLPHVTKARKALGEFLPAFEQVANQLTVLFADEKDLAGKVTELSRLIKEERQRADDAEKRADQLAEKAARNDKLEDALRTFFIAFDRLPVTMQGVSLIPGAVRPAIELYGTYEWKAVTDASFWVKEAMKDKRTL